MIFQFELRVQVIYLIILKIFSSRKLITTQVQFKNQNINKKKVRKRK